MLAQAGAHITNLEPALRAAVVGMGTPLRLERQAELRIELAVGLKDLLGRLVGVVVQHKQQVAVRGRVVGLQHQCLADTGFGILDASPVFQQITQAVVRVRAIGVKLQRAAHRDLGFFGAAQIVQHHVQIQVRDMKLFVQRNTAPKAGLGRLQATLALQGHTQIRIGRGVLRLELNRPGETELGLHQPALFDQCQTKRVEVAGIIGAQQRHLAQRAHRLLLLALRK